MLSWLLTAFAAPHPEFAILESRRALRDEDFAVARAHAETALATPGAHDQEAAWLVGLTHQYAGEPELAAQAFERALTLQPLGAYTDRIAINLAEVSADLGDTRDALRRLRRVRRHRDFDEETSTRFALDRAMWRLDRVQPDGSTRPRRRAVKRRTLVLVELLEQTPDRVASWQQARGHTQLAAAWLDLADQLGTADYTAIEHRALLVHHARKQLDATVAIGHDHFTLAQLHRLGRAFERLGDDVIETFGDPASLPPTERQKVQNVWVKARRYYDIAHRHAERTDRVDEAALYATALEAVELKVAGL